MKRYLIPVKYKRKHSYIFESLTSKLRFGIRGCIDFSFDPENHRECPLRPISKKLFLICYRFFEILVRFSSWYKISQFLETWNNHNLIQLLVAISCKLEIVSDIISSHWPTNQMIVNETILERYLQ